MTKRIVLSIFLCSLFACAAPDGVTADDDPAASDGIGTSPSDPLISCEGASCKVSPAARASHVQPCGLWWSPSSSALAVARHDAAPTDPDMAQVAIPGGLSCSALIAAAPAVVASQGGAVVVYYVQAPGKPIKPGTRWCAWPPSCTNPDAACCTATCTAGPDGTPICSND